RRFYKTSVCDHDTSIQGDLVLPCPSQLDFYGGIAKPELGAGQNGQFACDSAFVSIESFGIPENIIY
ncbi:MAG: hypothetical protein OEV21_04960, partial [Thermoplasmata archaeon]|nr:hypothetical protein [Thermoplasmata archaeon]